jgi:hypothetical protein
MQTMPAVWRNLVIPYGYKRIDKEMDAAPSSEGYSPLGCPKKDAPPSSFGSARSKVNISGLRGRRHGVPLRVRSTGGVPAVSVDG